MSYSSYSSYSDSGCQPNNEEVKYELLYDCQKLYKRLEEHQRRAFSDAFHELDSDDNGRVSVHELLDAYGDDYNEVSWAIEVCDSDGNGQLDFYETFALFVLENFEIYKFDVCDAYLVLDDKFDACSKCWKQRNSGVRCDGDDNGCCVICRPCSKDGMSPTHGKQFVTVKNRSLLSDRSPYCSLPSSSGSYAKELLTSSAKGGLKEGVKGFGASELFLYGGSFEDAKDAFLGDGVEGFVAAAIDEACTIM